MRHGLREYEGRKEARNREGAYLVFALGTSQ